MPENYSISDYFGGSGSDAYNEYKQGQSSGQWSDLNDYISQGGTSSGYNSGGGMIDYSQIPSVYDFATGLEGPISDAYRDYIMALRGQPLPLDVYTQLETAAGIPGMKATATTLREQIGSIEDTIKRVDPTIAATTRESMVTEGQREKMSMAGKKPLLERLGELTTGLGRVEQGIQAGMQDLATKVSLFMQGQDQQLEPFRIGIQAMTDRASRLIAAYGIDAQNQFEAYLANIRRGWDLSDQEREEAFKLLESENKYRQLLETTAAGAGIPLTGDESNDDLLNLIGGAAAEELRISRETSGGETNWWDAFNTGGSGWSIVPNESASGSQTMSPPPMSAKPGTVQEYNGFVWVMGTDGRWH